MSTAGTFDDHSRSCSFYAHFMTWLDELIRLMNSTKDNNSIVQVIGTGVRTTVSFPQPIIMFGKIRNCMISWYGIIINSPIHQRKCTKVQQKFYLLPKHSLKKNLISTKAITVRSSNWYVIRKHREIINSSLFCIYFELDSRLFKISVTILVKQIRVNSPFSFCIQTWKLSTIQWSKIPVTEIIIRRKKRSDSVTDFGYE